MSDESLNLNTAGTIIHTADDKMYLFKDDRQAISIGQVISPAAAIEWLKEKLGRELSYFEYGVLIADMRGGSKQITVITAPVADNSQQEGLISFGVKSLPIGYVIRIRVHASSVNYGDVIQTEGFYDKDGKLYGEVRKNYKQEPPLVKPLLDPIDFVAGPIANVVRGAARKLIGSAVAGIEARLLARGVRSDWANLATLGDEAVFSGTSSAGGTTLSGVGVAKLHAEHTARRTIIAGVDMAKIRTNLVAAAPEAGLYDVAVHGDELGFIMYENVGGKIAKRRITVTEVAELIRPRLAPNDAIRLLSCKVGVTGGPAQELSNLLGRRVWAATTKVPQRVRIVGKSGRSAFVPKADGKFYEFVPERGVFNSIGGGKNTSNALSGEIRNTR